MKYSLTDQQISIFVLSFLLALTSCTTSGKKSSESNLNFNASSADKAIFTLSTYAHLPERLAIKNLNSTGELEELIQNSKTEIRTVVQAQLKKAKLCYAQEDLLLFAKSLESIDEKFVFLDLYSRDIIWTLLLGLQSGKSQYFDYSLKKSEELLNHSNNQNFLIFAPEILKEVSELNRPFFDEKNYEWQINVRENYFLEYYLQGYNFFKNKFIQSADESSKKRTPDELEFANIKMKYKDHYHKQVDVIWANIQNLQVNPYLDPYAQERDVLKRKIVQAVLLAELMDDKIIKYPFLVDDIRFSQMRSAIDQFLYRNPVTTELTEESKKLNSIRRSGFIE